MNLSFPQIDCPTDKSDKLDNLPTPTESWIQIFTKIFLKIQEDCQQKREEEKMRNELLDCLDRIIKEKNVKIDLFGSSNDGFGMKKSDLDICLTFKDQPQQTVNILSSSSSYSSLFLF